MNTRLGAVSTSQWMIIEFILRLKRQLWSQYVKRLGERVGLVEHEMLSMVTVATRILSMHALHPEIQWWQQYSLRMWLHLLLFHTVSLRDAGSFNRVAFRPAKRLVFLATIEAEFTQEGVSWVSWERAMHIFKSWFGFKALWEARTR